MSVPTMGECYARLTEHLIKAQEEAAMIGHLFNAEGRSQMGRMWIETSDKLKKINYQLTLLAQGRLQ